MKEVLKSFLVMLGFDVDKKSEQNFTKSLKDTGDKLLDFKDIVAGIVTGAVVTGLYSQLTSVAMKFDNLGDAVNRIGNTSVKDLSSFSYAVQLLGGDIATAQQSYESLSRSIGQAVMGVGRAGPIFEQLGISMRNTAGDVKSVDEVWFELGAKIKGLTRSEQAAIVTRLGMTANVVESLTSEAEVFNAFREEYLSMYSPAGFDFEGAAAASAEFNDALDKLKLQIVAIRDVIGVQFLMDFRKQFESARAYVSSNMNGIVQSISAVIKIITTAGKIVMVFTKGIISASLIIFKIFNEFLDWFNELSSVWKVGCAAMLAAWLLFQKGILKSPLGKLLALVAVLGLLIDDFQTFQRGGKSFLDWNNGFLKFVSKFVSENQKLSIAVLLLLTNIRRVIGAGKTLTRLIKSAPIAARRFLGVLRSVAGALGKFSKAVIPIAVKGFALLSKGVMILATKVIPALLLGLKSLSVALLTTPIGWIILAITALIAIGVLLYKNWDTIKEYLISAWESIKGAVNDVIESIRAKWEVLKSWFSDTWGNIISTLQGYLDNIKQAWDNFIDYLASTPDRIRAAFQSFLDWLGTVIPNAVGAIGETAKGLWNDLVDVLPDSISAKLKMDDEPEPQAYEADYSPQKLEDTLSPQEWDAMERARAAGIDDPRWDMIEQERGVYSLRQAPLLEGQDTGLGLNLDTIAKAPQLMQPAANPSIVNNSTANTNTNITNNSDYNITINEARNPQATAEAVYNKLNGGGSLERNNMRLMQ